MGRIRRRACDAPTEQVACGAVRDGHSVVEKLMRWRGLITAVTLAVCVLLPAGRLRAASAGGVPHGLGGPGVLVTMAPSLDRDMQRTMTRAERSLTRFGLVLAYVAALWGWAALNTVAFLVVVSLASVADLRMFGLWRHSGGELWVYVAGGVRTFVRLLRDRRTPFRARAVLGLALLYWLLPTDLVGEGFFLFEGRIELSGLIEDLILAACAAKLFIHFCPDALIAQHAAAVESRVHAHA